MRTSCSRRPNSRFRAPAADRCWNRCRCCCAGSRCRAPRHRSSCRSPRACRAPAATSAAEAGKTRPAAVCARRTDGAPQARALSEAADRSRSTGCWSWTASVYRKKKRDHIVGSGRLVSRLLLLRVGGSGGGHGSPWAVVKFFQSAVGQEDSMTMDLLETRRVRWRTKNPQCFLKKKLMDLKKKREIHGMCSTKNINENFGLRCMKIYKHKVFSKKLFEITIKTYLWTAIITMCYV